MSSPRLEFAVEAVRTASRRILRFDAHRGDLKISYKSGNDMVTSADLAAESAVLRMIAEDYPEDGVLSEEAGASGDQSSCWVLDPIDGTTNFVHNLPDYAVSLAWCRDGEPEVGVVYDICRNDIYTAEKGRGAFCNQRRIRVSQTKGMRDALLCSTGSPGTRGWPWRMLAEASNGSSGFRRSGSATIDFVHAARGALDGCIGSNLSYWDYAAGSLILAEAGGAFSDLEGNGRVEFGAKLGFSIFGNPRIVASLRRLARSISPASDAGEAGE